MSEYETLKAVLQRAIKAGMLRVEAASERPIDEDGAVTHFTNTMPVSYLTFNDADELVSVGFVEAETSADLGSSRDAGKNRDRDMIRDARQADKQRAVK